MEARPAFGPGFQGARSKLYRAEYGAFFLVILGYLVYRSVYLGGLGWGETVIWLLIPDIVAFIPIGLSPKRKEWPWWGSHLYNAAHTMLLWGAAFGAVWLGSGMVYWPMLGWLAHITMDRAVGFGLRSRPERGVQRA